MRDDRCIKIILKEHLGEKALIRDIENILPLKKNTLYKKLRKLKCTYEDLYEKKYGYIVIDVDVFLDCFFLSQEEKGGNL